MKKRTVKEILFRYLVLVIGLFVMAFGVALSTKADLGVSPISCPPYVLSQVLPFTMGQIMFTMLTCFVLAQIVILRSEYQWLQLTQLIVAVIYSEMTDLTLWMIDGLEVSGYGTRWLLCIASFFLVAIGIATEVCADVSLMAGDGLVKAISHKTGVEFGKVKIGFDCTLTLLGAVIGLTAFHTLVGAREGTIAAAIFIGMIIHGIYRLPFVQRFLPASKRKAQAAPASVNCVEEK